MRFVTALTILFFFILGFFFTQHASQVFAFTSCANTSGGCCSGTDHDSFDSKTGLKVTTTPHVTCSGTTCSAVVSVPTSSTAYNAIVWSGPGVSCSGNAYCYTRPFQGNTKTLTNLQKGKTYSLKVSTSTSGGSIVSGYGVEYPGGQCNYHFIADVVTPPTATPTTKPGTPTATPTPTTPPASPTKLSIALQLPGIGVGGNLSPHHTTRTLHLSIYAADVDPTQPNVQPLFDSKTQTLTYNSSTGYFTNAGVNVGNLATGDYQLLVKVSGYLRRQYADTSSSTKTIHIESGQTTLVPTIKLIAGDIGPLYNVMDASDFYAIVGCYKDKANSSTCAVGSQIADINDDGTIDGIDLNYWLLGFQSLVSGNDPTGNGDGVTGD